MLRRLSLLVAALAVGLAACGGGAAPTEFVVNADDNFYDPAEWTVAAGETLTMTFVNVGFLEHEFQVVRLGEEIESMAEWDISKSLYNTGIVAGQTSGDFQFSIPEPGVYQVICTIQNHFDSGMEGTLTVEG
ncbi:MAG: cupredoxin domain-containing protein [Acidimicrobiia bacterium]